MAIDDLREAWGQPDLYVPSDGMAQTPGGSGLYSTDGFTESPEGSGFFAFSEIPSTSASVTAHMEANPWVEVFFPILDPLTVRVRVYRISDGRTQLVRGGVDIAPGVAAQDPEPPYNVESVYRAEMFDASGNSIGFTASASITVTVPATYATLHQVLDPSIWTTVRVMEGTAPSVVRKTPGSLVYPEASPLPRRIGSRRQAVSGLPLYLYTNTIDAADAVQQMLGDYETEQLGVLVLRTTPQDLARVPRTLFVASESFEEQDLDVKYGGSQIMYAFTGDEVEPPYPGLVVPPLTYDDIDASFATYDDEDAAYATYTDRDRAYELAGAAG